MEQDVGHKAGEENDLRAGEVDGQVDGLQVGRLANAANLCSETLKLNVSKTQLTLGNKV